MRISSDGCCAESLQGRQRSIDLAEDASISIDRSSLVAAIECRDLAAPPLVNALDEVMPLALA